MVRIAKEIGREVATAEDARRIMKIGTWYNSPEETLFNLGLPPNRTGGQQGFIVHEMSGKLSKAIAHILPSGSKVDEPYIFYSTGLFRTEGLFQARCAR